jgi:hypothetical protein
MPSNGEVTVCQICGKPLSEQDGSQTCKGWTHPTAAFSKPIHPARLQAERLVKADELALTTRKLEAWKALCRAGQRHFAATLDNLGEANAATDEELTLSAKQYNEAEANLRALGELAPIEVRP